MNLRRRPMKHADIDQCMELIARHPDFASLYGGQREPLGEILKRLIGTRGFLTTVIEEIGGQRAQMLAVGAVAFLNAEFVKKAKRSPFFWIAPTLIHELLEGNTPILSDTDVCRENALAGLTVFAWPLCFPRNQHSPEFLNYVMGSFISEIRGYKLKEFLGQTTDVEGARTSLHSGAILLTPGGPYTQLPAGTEDQLLLNPHLLVITRERALQKVGSWSSSLFIYSPPVIGFSRCEQRLLDQALRGGTDEELANELEISISAVKKAWRSIYDKADRSKTGILPPGSTEIETTDRGRGKKHRLLTYVREHPEELRPISMKLLRQAQKDVKSDQKGNAVSPLRRRVGRPRFTNT
jgi:DNA-binding CsgD family transcriptional regulator